MNSFSNQPHDEPSETATSVQEGVISDPTVLKSEEGNWQHLEEMPLDALEKKVDELEASLQQAVNFVRDQEEEVLQKLDEIDNLRGKLPTVMGQEYTALTDEILEEEDRYHFLAKTLIGQRRNLEALKLSLNQHQQIFLKRKREAIHKLEEQGLNVYSVDHQVSYFSPLKHRFQFTFSYSVLYAASAALIFLLTLPSVIFRVSPLSILQALGDQQGREAVFSGDSWKLQNRLQEIQLQEEDYRDLEN